MIHLMLDAYGGSESRLDDLRVVNTVLNDLVSVLQIESVMPPFLLPYFYAKDSDDDGISAFVILHGGHITLHTFPRRGCVFADLLYDGNASEQKLIQVLKSHFSFVEEKTLRTERKFYDKTIDPTRIWTGLGDGGFGPHTIAKVENVQTNIEQIFDMLDEMPQKINMQPISRPYVIKSRGKSPDYISGIVLIAQSHIAFHYCVSERTLFCDASSCSFYKSEQFVECLKTRFNSFEHMTLIRGSKPEKRP